MTVGRRPSDHGSSQRDSWCPYCGEPVLRGRAVGGAIVLLEVWASPSGRWAIDEPSGLAYRRPLANGEGHLLHAAACARWGELPRLPRANGHRRALPRRLSRTLGGAGG